MSAARPRLERGRAALPRGGVMTSSEPRRLAGTGLLACVVLLGGCREQAGVVLEGRPAPDIQALAVDGQPFHLSDHRDKVVLLTFGYTSCPDVCPLTLSRLKGLLRRLGP